MKSSLSMNLLILPTFFKKALISYAGSMLFVCLLYSSAFCELKNIPVINGAYDISLPDCISLALRHNRSIQTAYMDRVIQKYNLKVAEDEFYPDMTITSSIQHSSTGDTENRYYTNSGSLSASISEKIPTGGVFTFSWANTIDRKYDKLPDDSYGSSWSIDFTQPLLKGGGISVNTISLESARISEQINIISLRSNIINTITSVITTYRSFYQAQKSLEITRNSVKRAKDLLKINNALIQAGRMAEVEIVQTQADVANREFSLTQSENAMNAARLSLIKILDIDKGTQFKAIEKIETNNIVPDPEKCLDLAFKNRTDYLQTLLNMRTTDLELVAAENNILWDLPLRVGWGISGADTDEFEHAYKKAQNAGRGSWHVGVSLNIPFGDMSRKQRLLSAKINVKKAKINLKELRENVEIDIQDSVRDVRMKLRQVELSQSARQLSEKKLEIEKEKLKVGRSTNFQLVSFQNDLINSQNNELNAVISYQNALTSLDQSLGTTLDTWKIKIEEEYQ